jgi:hypothetical protein
VTIYRCDTCRVDYARVRRRRGAPFRCSCGRETRRVVTKYGLGRITLAGAEFPAALRGAPVREVVCDEVEQP